jgi:hypothetical protein
MQRNTLGRWHRREKAWKLFPMDLRMGAQSNKEKKLEDYEIT